MSVWPFESNRSVSKYRSTIYDSSCATINFQCFSFTEDKNYTVLTKDVLKFLDDVHDTLMREVLEEGSKRENKVVNFQHPKDLKVTHSSSLLFESV